jgi:hypothetical protein
LANLKVLMPGFAFRRSTVLDVADVAKVLVRSECPLAPKATIMNLRRFMRAPQILDWHRND